MAWATHRRLGFWTTRVRTASNAVDAQYDNYYFMSLRCQDSGVGGSPVRILNGYIVNDASHTTLYNGALRPRTSAPFLRVAASGGLADARFGFFIPETDPELDVLIQGVGGYIYVIVNGTLYARIDVSDLTTLDYGPRFGWLGDGSGTDGNVSLLRSAFVGTPDPTNAIPDEDVFDSVATDATLSGDGTSGSPLSVVSWQDAYPDATDRAYPRDTHALDVAVHGRGKSASALARSFTVSISDRAEITSNVWLQVDISTTARTIARANRAALATNTNDVTINAASVSQSVRNSAAADIIGGSDLRVDLIWYSVASGGSAISRQRYVIPVIAQSSGSAQSTRVHSQNVRCRDWQIGYTLTQVGQSQTVVIFMQVLMMIGSHLSVDLPRGILNKLYNINTAGDTGNADLDYACILVLATRIHCNWLYFAKTSANNELFDRANVTVDPMPLRNLEKIK